MLLVIHIFQRTVAERREILQKLALISVKAIDVANFLDLWQFSDQRNSKPLLLSQLVLQDSFQAKILDESEK